MLGKDPVATARGSDIELGKEPLVLTVSVRRGAARFDIECYDEPGRDVLRFWPLRASGAQRRFLAGLADVVGEGTGAGMSGWIVS